ncbi:MAG: DUF1565 domain-containing protein [Deltaproteobacteria bacterium]|nr:MAG: DUF1565 domain-containing protein [Deltaproteobacteria bacterium]
MNRLDLHGLMARTSAVLVLLLLASACGSGVTGGPGGSGGPSGPPAPVSFVDAVNGSDANDGQSVKSAFRTLQRAAKELRPGWTIQILNGTYTTDGSTEPLLIDVSGTPDAWLTITAAQGQHPVIQIPAGSGGWSGIHLLGAAYVIIDGIEIVGQGASIGRAQAAANATSKSALYNHNCIYVDGVGSAGVHPAVPHDIVIRNSILRNCTAAGIEVNAGDAITILHNKVADNSWWTVFDTSGIGLYHLTDSPSASAKNGYKNFIVGNEVWGNRNEMACAACKPPAIYDGNGIIVDDALHTQDALGQNDVIGVPYTGRTYIANNIVHDNGGRGIHIYRSDHVDVVNNTTFDNMLSTSEFLKAGEMDGFDSHDVQFLNNVSVNHSGKDLTIDAPNETSRFDFNVWEGSTPRHGPNDVLGAAHLADPANGNFAPQPGSPALGSGTATLAPADDFSGKPRPAGRIDRGAIQVTQ